MSENNLMDSLWQLVETVTVPGILLGSFVIFLVYRYVKNTWFTPLGKIPGPWHMALSEIVPTIKAFQGVKPTYMRNLHLKYGPLVRIGPNVVSVADPQSVRTIQSSHRFIKSELYEAFRSVDQHNIVSLRDPEEFKKRKALIAPIFSMSSITKQEPLIKEVGIKKLKARFQKAAETGETIDALRWFMAMTFDVIGALSLGDSFNILETEYHPIITWLADAGMIRFCRYLFGYRLADWILPRQARNDRNLAEYATCMLEERKKDKNPPNDLLQRLIEATDEDGNHLPDIIIIAEVIIQMAGGTDTVASSLTWIINSLLDHPEWFDRIYEELRTELDDAPENVPASKLARLPVLNAVINETARLFPAAVQDLPRIVPPEGVEFCGKFIPGGTVVNMQMFTIQTHPNLWEDPLEFKPERWLKDPPTDALDEIMPFSRGVRLCLGINLAKLEVRLTIATLVYHFKFERVGNDDMSYNAVSVTFPRCHRLNVRVTERVH